MSDIFAFIQWLITNLGILNAVLILVIGGLVWLYIGERKDRRFAWKEHNNLLVSNVQTLSKMEIAITLIADRVR